MSITIIYTNAEGSTMSDTFSFHRNLDQKDFDNMVLAVQQTVNNMPLNNLNTSEGVTTMETVKSESKSDAPAYPHESAARPVSQAEAEKILKKLSSKKAA